MPELPEVETIARGVHERVVGDRIAQAWFGGHREPFKTAPSRQAMGLEGMVFVSIHRTGKHIVSLESGRELRFVDPRRFGRLEFRELGMDQQFISPGADPLTIGRVEFAALFRGRRLAIKAALLNQSLLAGVGNIYADESLFHAGIRPRKSAGRLTREELERLRLALKKILRHAIRLGGSSVSDYVDANGVRGFFQLEHRVYLRTGEPCRECGTAIRRIIIAGRGTHYCPSCQH